VGAEVVKFEFRTTHPYTKLFVKGAPDIRVLELCRQSYAEAVLLLFAQKTFFFYAEPEETTDWFERLAKPQRAAVEEVRLCCFHAMTVPFQIFPGLKTLIVLHSRFCGCPDFCGRVNPRYGSVSRMTS
jgi:hypothetical protein